MSNFGRLVADGLLIDLGGLSAPILIRHAIDLNEVKGGLDAFQAEAFFVCCCFDHSNKSSDFRRIREPGGAFPIGFIIPSLYYSEPEQFYETKFLADFAYASFVWFWKEIAGANGILGNDLLLGRVGEVEFFELLPEVLSFAVFSKDAVKKSKLSPAQIELSLARKGLSVIKDANDFLVKQQLHPRLSAAFADKVRPPEPLRSIAIKRLPVTCARVQQLMLEVIGMADQEMAGVGAFLCLYQIYEYLIEDMFAYLVFETTQSSMSAWDLRKKLTESAAELYRLHLVANRATGGGANSQVFDDLKNYCLVLLKECGVHAGLENKPWIDAVYACRNTLIHNQLLVHRSGAFKHLLPLNICMHRSALELMFHY